MIGDDDIRSNYGIRPLDYHGTFETIRYDTIRYDTTWMILDWNTDDFEPA